MRWDRTAASRFQVLAGSGEDGPGWKIQKLFNLAGADWPADQKALCLVATFLPQELEMMRYLNALGDDAETKAVRQGDDGAGDSAVFPVFSDAAYEGPVDLDGVDGQFVQVTQRRVPGTEIID